MICRIFTCKSPIQEACKIINSCHPTMQNLLELKVPTQQGIDQ